MFETASRRDFLARTGMGFGSLGLTALLGDLLKQTAGAGELSPMAPRAPHFAAKAKRIVHIFANGAPSHIDTWDPKPALAKYDGKVVKEVDGIAYASPFKFKKSGKSGTEVSEVFPKLAEHVDDLAVIRSMNTDIPAHEAATMMMNTGNARLVRPSVGSWLTYGLGSVNQNLPGFIAMAPGTPLNGAQNWRSAFLPGAYQGTYINSTQSDIEKLIENIKNHYVGAKEQRSQLDLLTKLNERHDEKLKNEAELESRVQTFELAYKMQVEATDAFDISKEPAHVRELYGADSVQGKQLMIARRLLERGVRVVQCWHSGWDHHQNLESALKAKAREIDAPLAAFLTDLKQRDMLKDTLVVWGGEFGRMPRRQAPNAAISAAALPGRDHNNKGFCCWMAGGGVKGGTVHGATDELGYAAVQDKVHVHDLHATILHLMGFDHEKLTYRYAGRDFRLTDVYGKVVKEVLA